MEGFHLHDFVRIENLLSADREYSGSEGVVRAPRLGDKATIVHFYDEKKPNVPMVLECVDSKGYIIWLADFYADEIELIWKAPSPDAKRPWWKFW